MFHVMYLNLSDNEPFLNKGGRRAGKTPLWLRAIFQRSWIGPEAVCRYGTQRGNHPIEIDEPVAPMTCGGRALPTASEEKLLLTRLVKAGG